MSSILKALKRLEQEKAVRRPHEIRVDAEIIRNVPLHRRTPLFVVLLGALALFLGGGAAVYLVLKPSSGQRITVQEAMIPKNTPPVAVPSATPETSATIKGEKSATAGPESAPRAIHLHNQLKNLVPSPVALPQNILQKQPEAGPSAPQIPQAAATPPPQQSIPKTELHLDGIAFQDGGGESLAVINGRTVTRGAVIEGARIEDIQRDRVKLSRGGERFEIILDRSN